MDRREFVSLFRERGHDRERLGRMPFNPDLCELISKQRSANTRLSDMTALEVAVALGAGERIHVEDGYRCSYRLDELE